MTIIYINVHSGQYMHVSAADTVWQKKVGTPNFVYKEL